jgi:uncharacterized protein YjbI with pentapeptide repeats
MNPDEIKNILDQHANWLADHTTGKRANLTGANLTGAYLPDADRTVADLTGAYLFCSNLTDANLTGVNLSRAIIAFGWELVRA